jgi:hypothetical protein
MPGSLLCLLYITDAAGNMMWTAMLCVRWHFSGNIKHFTLTNLVLIKHTGQRSVLIPDTASKQSSCLGRVVYSPTLANVDKLLSSEEEESIYQ